MPRFRLKTLLALLSACCLALGVWKAREIWSPYFVPVGDKGVTLRVTSHLPANPQTLQRLVPDCGDRLVVQVVAGTRWLCSLRVDGGEAFQTRFATEPVGFAGNRYAELTFQIDGDRVTITNANGVELYSHEIPPDATQRTFVKAIYSEYSQSGRSRHQVGIFNAYGADLVSLRFDIAAELE